VLGANDADGGFLNSLPALQVTFSSEDCFDIDFLQYGEQRVDDLSHRLSVTWRLYFTTIKLEVAT